MRPEERAGDVPPPFPPRRVARGIVQTERHLLGKLPERVGLGLDPAQRRLRFAFSQHYAETLDIFTESGIFTHAVNIMKSVNMQSPSEADALRILREVPGLTVESRPPNKDKGSVVIKFGSERRAVALEFKKLANAATAWHVVHTAEARPTVARMLVASESTAEARAILMRHGIAFADAMGNAHIELPGLLLHVGDSSRGRPSTKAMPPRLSGKAGVIAQALLLHPDRVWHIGDLAKEAAVSTALAYRVLNRLGAESIIETEGKGPTKLRRLADFPALLDLWAEEEGGRPTRTRAFVLAQTPRQLIEKVTGDLQEAKLDHALTGAAAASLIAPFVTAVPVVELWVTALAAPNELHSRLGSEAVGEGANVILLQQRGDTPLAFRVRTNETWISNRFRIYVDLLKDPRRGREQAQRLRSEVIDR